MILASSATRNLQLPYLRSRQSLTEKLLGLIPVNQQEDLFLLNQILLFEGTNPGNPDLLELSDLPHPMLDKLIQLLLTGSYLSLITQEEQGQMSYPIYLLHLYREKNRWLIEGFDLQAEKVKIYAVDGLADILPYTGKNRLSRKKIKELLSTQEEETNLVLELGPSAIAQFRKYHPLRMSISYTNPYQTTAILKTYIHADNPDELSEIINWLLFLDGDVKVKEMPEEVLTGIQERFRLFCAKQQSS